MTNAPNTIAILRPYIVPIQKAVMHHYSRRHNPAHRQAVHNWVKALRDAYTSTGYLDALKAKQ